VSITLLLDLDDTLLENNMDTFVPGYLSAFGRHVANEVDPQQFIDALLLGTRHMTVNRRPDCTLKDVFEEKFFAKLPVDAEHFHQIAAQFYETVFPSLRSLTRPRPHAVALVEEAFRRGYRVAIATNPLFPKTAILQRLEWANLPVEKYPFELVPGYESFHFAKPDPAYFTEMLAQMGWPEGQVVMVGDDFNLDIASANRVGLATFWLSGHSPQKLPGLDNLKAPAQSGQLEDILPWLDQWLQSDSKPNYLTPAAILAILRATPAALQSLSQTTPTSLWRLRPQSDEWCFTELLCHFRDVEQEVNLPRLHKVIEEDYPFLPGQDTDPWAEQRNYIQQDGAQALHLFMRTRMKLLDILESLKPDDWQRPFRHAIFGPTHLVEMVGIIASHDRLHLRQIKNVIREVALLS
jgi:HAD superfamily hydrolase (TIGR01549 family)